jgi:hypothetical protein
MWSHLKRKFLKKWFFSSNIIKTQVLKRRSIEKKERKSIEKREREKEKERKRKKRKKRKAPRVSSNKGEVNILRGEKHLNFRNLFLIWFFSPFIISFQKSFPKS